MRNVFSFFAIFFLLTLGAVAASRQQAAPQSRGRQESRSEAARSAPKNTETETAPTTPKATQGRAAVARKVAQPASQRETSTASSPLSAPRPQVQSRSAVQGKVVSRSAVKNAVVSPAQTARGRPSVAAANVSRAGVKPAIMSAATRTTAVAARAAANSPAGRARAAATTKVVGTSISNNYTVCREAYFSCMDEFCANKDASVRRCACSSRLHEFDADKKAIEEVENKLTDFNERLLNVNMDKEDVAAMNKATEGENAYNTKDASASQKALDSILQKINATSSDAQQTQSLVSLSLSTIASGGDMFDNVDSMMGSSTATKEGEELYRAALPTCVEIANEICEPADIPIIQSAYLMSVEQDCNTLAKNYETLRTTALGKAREGGALLDMSRLTNHQDRNSGDIMTCTNKMMEIINTDSVCGSDLGKCLDWSGKYIDPSTGGAILSDNLYNLSEVMERPEGDQKWVEVPKNTNMVRFLESKRTYIEPAMETCETIKDVVWSNFLEEAMAKIKVAQNQKLEDMRQNCTSLVGQCKSATAKSIQDFDARALSIFGVSADMTVNKMCSGIQTACSALMNRSGDTVGGWETGIQDVDLQKTYQTLLQNCKLVGQECVKLQCQTNENQFGLCYEQNAMQRRSILGLSTDNNHCYGQVFTCVNKLSDTDLNNIKAKYGSDFSGISLEPGKIDNDGSEWSYANNEISPQQQIARNIWGRCDFYSLVSEGNNIYKNPEKPTILSWFGDNTNSECYTGYCEGEGTFIYGRPGELNTCGSQGSSAYEYCGDNMGNGGILGENQQSILIIYDVSKDGEGLNSYDKDLESSFVYGTTSDSNLNPDKAHFTNCCYSETKDSYGNCCEDNTESNMSGLVVESAVPMTSKNSDSSGPLPPFSNNCDPKRACCFEGLNNNTGSSGHLTLKYCKPGNSSTWQYIATKETTNLFCLGTLDDNNCKQGTLVTVDENGIYRSKFGDQGVEKYLNYFYANTTNEFEDQDGHHVLYVYRPDGVIKDDDDNSTPSGPGYYSFSGDLPISSKIKNSVDIDHSVAYCERGFVISLHNFKCATIGEPSNF